MIGKLFEFYNFLIFIPNNLIKVRNHGIIEMIDAVLFKDTKMLSARLSSNKHPIKGTDKRMLRF